ncbi:MAG: hypothetical protein JJE04_00180 [Acidobacteriia bacterium]|nr:hypothetical protein [Terriglobia bacterium]
MRNWILAALIATGNLTAQTPTMAVTPDPIVECNEAGLGRARILWDAPDAASTLIRVGASDGTPMNSATSPTGAASTGDWVTDGMLFFLIDASGKVLAQARANVTCGDSSRSMLPLAVGNQWVYQYSSRQITSDYQTWTVTRSQEVDGKVYYVLAIDGRENTAYRTAASGKIFVKGPADPASSERLWLDPGIPQDQSGILQITGAEPEATVPAGAFHNGNRFRTGGGLEISMGVIVAGVGIVSRQTGLLAGSSGGFLNGIELVYARLGDRTVYSAPELSFSLSTDSHVLTLQPGKVTNCAVPCYFVACGLGPGADPPNTFKPCLRARLTLRNTSAVPLELMFPDSRIFEVELLRENGQAVYRRSSGAFPPEQPKVIYQQGETHYLQQVPLYSVPNQPIAPGRYTLSASIESMDGHKFTATVPVLILE